MEFVATCLCTEKEFSFDQDERNLITAGDLKIPLAVIDCE